jgi:hypothetical protein
MNPCPYGFYGNLDNGNEVANPPDETINFGDADGAPGDTKTDLVVNDTPLTMLSKYIVGGLEAVSGSYAIDVEGIVNQIWYPGVD